MNPRLQQAAEARWATWSRRPTPRLLLHFFQRFFESDLTSGQGDLRISIGGVFAVLALPGIMLPLLLIDKYSSLLAYFRGHPGIDRLAISVSDKYMFLALAMTVVGIVTVLKWESLFPDRVDYANLAPAPLQVRQIFVAKFSALMILLALFIIDVNLVSSVMFPVMVLAEQGTQAETLRFIGSHLVAVVAASVFAFFFFMALAGALMTLLPYRLFRRVSLWVQSLCIVYLLVTLILGPRILHMARDPGGPSLLVTAGFPPLWFLGLYQRLHGYADPVFHSLGGIALTALPLTIAVSLLAYALSYRLYYSRIPEILEPPRRGPGRLKQRLQDFLGRCFLGPPFERGCFHFAVQTLARSQRHCLLFAGYCSVGIAILLQELLAYLSRPEAVLRQPTPVLLSIPLIVSFFLLSGLRLVFALPAELPANWVFRLMGDRSEETGRRVAKRVMLGLLSAALAGVFLPIYVWLWGPALGLAHIGMVWLFSALLCTVLLVNFPKIPFTCSYLPGKRNTVLVLAVSVVAFFGFAYMVAGVEYAVLRNPRQALFYLVILGMGWAGFRYYRDEWSDGDGALVFEEAPEPIVRTLNLAE